MQNTRELEIKWEKSKNKINQLLETKDKSTVNMLKFYKLYKKKMEAYKKFGTAKYLHEAFPNATYIGFTGTPVETKDKSTVNMLKFYKLYINAPYDKTALDLFELAFSGWYKEKMEG